MSARAVAVLVVLLLALGGGALYLQRQEATERPANAAALGQPVLKDLKAADIAAIRIVEPKATLTLQRRDDGWTIAERDGFPADTARVRDFVLKAIELKVGQSEPIGEQDRGRLKLDASGTAVDFLAAGDKPLAKLVVGKKYFSREPDNPERAPGDGRFVLRPDSPGTVFIVKDPLAQATARSADWIRRSGPKIEKVKTLEVRPQQGGGYRIERSGDNADWKLADAKAGEKLEVTRANAASYVLGQIELADVAPKEDRDNPAVTGLDKPTLIDATTLAGTRYELKVGMLSGDNYYVALSTTSSDPQDQLLARHVLLVPKSKLEDTLKPRADMLAKKEDTKK